jgi:amidase
MSLNTVKPPTLEQLGEVAAELGFAFAEADLAAHRESLMPAFEAYNQLDQMPDELPPSAIRGCPAVAPRPRRTGTARGTSRPRSRVRPPANSRARKSR